MLPVWARQDLITDLDNLATLCRSDHMLKHASRWSMRQLDHGVIEWTSPLGEVIVDAPRPIGPTFAELEPALRASYHGDAATVARIAASIISSVVPFGAPCPRTNCSTSQPSRVGT